MADEIFAPVQFEKAPEVFDEKPRIAPSNCSNETPSSAIRRVSG